MKTLLTLFILTSIISSSLLAQTASEKRDIDLMLIRGEYRQVTDTCSQILAVDSLNSEIYYKMGLAWQNLVSDDKALDCFLKASTISPENSNYNFALAKSYFNKGKLSRAKPIFLKLCETDSLNWPYASYLTGILMQEDKYDESIKLYYRFYQKDYNNYMFADKIGFAYLKKGDLNIARSLFERSLSLNPSNINSIKNLAYIYAGTVGADTAIWLLSKGIAIDSTDMDLYARRAAINFSTFNFKRALSDYLRLLGSGDSSVLNLKRTGIGYAKFNKPADAIFYLLKAYAKDTADLDLVSNIAQNYSQLKQYKNSVVYYRKLLDLLAPYETGLGLNYLLLAESLKADGQYNDAIKAYLKSQEYRSDISVIMIVANLYDEKLKDRSHAIRYYELYLNKLKSSKTQYDSDYTESVQKRIETLRKQDVR